MYCYSVTLSEIPLMFCFTYKETASYYRGTINQCYEPEYSIRIPKNDVVQWMKQWNCNNAAYAEYVLSCSFACDALMKHSRFVFHGAAFLWNNHAYIISAPSGIGKTTQLLHWNSLYSQEVTILNGDKPILEICSNNTVLVHPSPWKGKEGLGRDDIIAPLGGIIMLQQSDKNYIEQVTPDNAAKYLFGRIYSTFTCKEDILHAAHLIENLLTYVPVWLLRNKGDKESARLTYRTLQEAHS